MGFLGIPGLSFSWKRAIGITKVKQKISRKTDIPLTRQGMQRKVGSMLINTILDDTKKRK